MGWIRGNAPAKLGNRIPQDVLEIRTKAKQSVEHVENISGTLEGHSQPQTQNISEPAKNIHYSQQRLQTRNFPSFPRMLCDRNENQAPYLEPSARMETLRTTG